MVANTLVLTVMCSCRPTQITVCLTARTEVRGHRGAAARRCVLCCLRHPRPETAELFDSTCRGIEPRTSRGSVGGARCSAGGNAHNAATSLAADNCDWRRSAQSCQSSRPKRPTAERLWHQRGLADTVEPNSGQWTGLPRSRTSSKPCHGAGGWLCAASC